MIYNKSDSYDVQVNFLYSQTSASTFKCNKSRSVRTIPMFYTFFV